MSAYGAGKAVSVFSKILFTITRLTISFFTQKDTDFRRTWNKEEYAAKAKARESRDRLAEKNDERKKLGLPPLKPRREYNDDDSNKEALKSREKKVDIEQNVGKIQVVQAVDSKKQPGFYCKDCDVTIKDSVTYIDHLNGRKRKCSLKLFQLIKENLSIVFQI